MPLSVCHQSQSPVHSFSDDRYGSNKGKPEYGEASHITTRQCGDADRKKDEVQEASSAGQDPEATKNTTRIKELSLNEVKGCMNQL